MSLYEQTLVWVELETEGEVITSFCTGEGTVSERFSNYVDNLSSIQPLKCIKMGMLGFGESVDV